MTRDHRIYNMNNAYLRGDNFDGRALSYGMGTPDVNGTRQTHQVPAHTSAPNAVHISRDVARPQNTPHVSTPQPPQKPKRRIGMWVAIVLAIVCILLACLLAATMCSSNKSARSGAIGQLEGKTAEEVQAELDRIVEEGMFNISIASTVDIPDGSALADLRIENVPGNRYLMRVVITDDATNNTLYTTDLIEPNHHIQQDTLDVDLDAGTYECTATFIAYDPESEEEVGQAAAKMTIRVEG